MLEILQFVFSSFWVWAGTMYLFGAFLKCVFMCWNRLLRHLSVKNAGWPPDHIDADGDWKPEPKTE